MDENVIMLDAQTSEPDTEFEIGLPDGFGDGDDIFADPSEWKGSTSNEGSQESDTTESDAPTTEQSAEGNEEQGAETEQLPTTQPEVAAPRKLKFQATIDHQSQDVEIDESDLPTLYQKAQNLDRAQERQRQGSARLGKMEKLAKALEYTDTDDFYKGTVENLVAQRKNELIAEGVHAAVAERMAQQDYADLMSDVGNTQAAPTNGTPDRNFTGETRELLSKHPELGPGNPVPQEVVLEAARPGGPSLLQAYESYLQRQKKSEQAEMNALRKENKTLKQNAEAASRAPVRSATKGGATGVTEEDPFLKGLLSDDIW